MNTALQTLPGDPPINHGTKGRLGLKDPRVIVCEDRGMDAYREDHNDLFAPPPRNARPWTPPKGMSPCDAIRSELRKARKYLNGCDDQNRWFVPNRRIYEIMTLDKIQAAIESLTRNPHHRVSTRDLALQIRNGGGSLCSAPSVKVFTILINIEKEECLFEILRSRITDECIPSKTRPSEEGYVICNKHQQKHAVAGHVTTTTLELFCSNSYFFISPYIKGAPGKHVHMVLDNDDLPFVSKSPLASPQIRTSRHDPVTGARSTQPKGEGGFGAVFAVEIDEDNFNFEELGIPRGLRKCALKKLFDSDFNSFNLELASMLPFQQYPRLHVIQVLATFEVRKAGEAPTFYFLLPFANGDLWEFFKLVDASNVRSKRASWVAGQCFELANALRLVHNERIHHIPHYTSINLINDENRELYGRHGDIKGDNILFFEFQSNYDLKLADFGLGRLHTCISRSMQDPHHLDNSSTYRAPEFDITGGKISRKADIFSLGCVFLEIVTWLLEGYDVAQDVFTKARLEAGLKPNWNEDTFFSLKRRPSGEIFATRKSKVTAWIERLRNCPQHSAYTNQFLSLIDDRMLVPEAEGRASSGEICRELGKMSATCRAESDYIRPRKSRSL